MTGAGAARGHTAAAVRSRLRSPGALAALAALAGLALTAVVAGGLLAEAQREAAATLDGTARDVAVRIDRRVEVAESVLSTMAAQVGTGVASPREVQRVLARTTVVEQVPGMLALVYAAASTTEDGPRVAPLAIHPLTPNVGALGRNILQDPERRRAVEAARDRGTTTATSVVTHVDGGVDAILVVVPVFRGTPGTLAERRDSFLGVMMGVVSPQGLFTDVARLPVDVVVEDLGPSDVVRRPPTPLARLWASEGAPADDRGSHASLLQVADRTWRLLVTPGPAFATGTGAAAVAAFAGVLLSLLLALLVHVLVDRRGRLASLVAERTSELRRTNEELERASALQSQFITTVSHELRTPLTSVIGFIQTVRKLGPGHEAAREDFLARAERNGMTLRRMIEELLDFGRLERGELRLDPRPTDLGLLTAEVVRDLQGLLGGRAAVLRLDPATWALVDRDAVTRIVTNLVANAVRYAPGAGPVELVVARRDGVVTLACRDRGPGFLERDLPVLCERFVRGSGVMGEGTGIGLAVVRELARGHGGEVALANRAGGGAEVLVTLPAAPARVVTSAVPDELAASSG